MKSAYLVFGLLIFACLMISPVMGETLEGSIGSNTISSDNYANPTAGAGWNGYCGIKFVDIEKSQGAFSIVNWWTTAVPTFWDGPIVESAFVPVTFRLATVDMGNPDIKGVNCPTVRNGTVIGTGSIGYQRVFNAQGVEQLNGFAYVMFDNGLNVTGLSGTQYVYIEYDRADLYYIRGNEGGWTGPATGQAVFWYGSPVSGSYVFNKYVSASATYTATKPAGLGIMGNITKTGTTLSRGYVFDANGNVLSNEYTLSVNTFSFNTNATQVKLGIKDGLGNFYNTSVLFTNTVPTLTPTPTPTQTIAPLDYTLTLNKTAVSFGQGILATIASESDPSLDHVNGISYSFVTPTSTPNTVSAKEAGSTNNIMNYYLMEGTWWGYQDSTNAWTNELAGIPNPTVLTFPETGSITVKVNINTDNGDNKEISIPVTVGSGNFVVTPFRAYDGSNYNFLQAVAINVKNLNTGVWTNGTYYNGMVSITTPPNQVLSAYGTKEGYYPAKYENAPADGTPYSLVFYEIGAPPETDYQIFYVNTLTPAGVRVTGAQARALESGSANVTTGTTNAAGVAQLNLRTNTTYVISATKTGYTGSSATVTTNTGMSDSITLTMIPLVTPTVIPTGSWTVNPSVTPTGGGNTTFWRPWTDLFSQMGASNYELPLLLAAFIILMCMIVGFAMAGTLGGEVAMGFGAILCVAIGLIPIWVVLAIIILGFLFYGLKVVK